MDKTCPICTEKLLDDVVITYCDHFFHKHCISKWKKLQKNATCPLCRNERLVWVKEKLNMKSLRKSYMIKAFKVEQLVLELQKAEIMINKYKDIAKDSKTHNSILQNKITILENLIPK